MPEPVVRRAFGQGHTLIEARKLRRLMHPNDPPRFTIGPIFDNDCQLHPRTALVHEAETVSASPQTRPAGWRHAGYWVEEQIAIFT
jgi:hypothetical protein